MTGARVDVLGNCILCGLEPGATEDCDNCQKVRDGFPTCPCCGEPLLADQEWQLRNDRTPGTRAREGDYVHAWCDDRLNTEVAEVGGDSDG